MKNNESLLIIKPDAFQRKLVGDIISIVEKKFLIKRISVFKFSRSLAEEFYFEHKNKSFYNELVEFIISDCVVPIILSGESSIITDLRLVVGNTDFSKADKNSIRGIFATSLIRNVVHASDSLSSYLRESFLIFK